MSDLAEYSRYKFAYESATGGKEMSQRKLPFEALMQASGPISPKIIEHESFVAKEISLYLTSKAFHI